MSYRQARSHKALVMKSFNPRLLFPEGDATTFGFSASTSCCFNPRLLFPEGDAAKGWNAHRWKPVSIHASCFQKAMPRRSDLVRARPVVSIHASCFQKAMPQRAGTRTAGNPFQSTPPVSRRRCSCVKLSSLAVSLFQSTPPVSRRRCPRHSRQAIAPRRVSIHASCFQKAMPKATQLCRCESSFQSTPLFPEGDAATAPATTASSVGFNPRLLFPEGDALGRSARNPFILVSIHASCFQKAMLGQTVPAATTMSFQSTPPVSRRRCSLSSGAIVLDNGFNPRLLFPEGDAGGVAEKGWSFGGFNPRLLFPEGDAWEHIFCWWDAPVSIHASCFQKAMLNLHVENSVFDRFQSTPPVSRRRCRHGRCAAQCDVAVSIHASCFQKAMRPVVNSKSINAAVSIHASCFQKAMPAGSTHKSGLQYVSIHASCFQKAMHG